MSELLLIRLTTPGKNYKLTEPCRNWAALAACESELQKRRTRLGLDREASRPCGRAAGFGTTGALTGTIRGKHPQDTYGAQMQAMSNTLPDEAAMKNVIAYIISLEN